MTSVERAELQAELEQLRADYAELMGVARSRQERLRAAQAENARLAEALRLVEGLANVWERVGATGDMSPVRAHSALISVLEEAAR